MPQLNLSFHSIEEDHFQKTYYHVRFDHSVVALVMTQTHLEDLEGYQPDLSSRPFNLGLLKHQPDRGIHVFYHVKQHGKLYLGNWWYLTNTLMWNQLEYVFLYVSWKNNRLNLFMWAFERVRIQMAVINQVSGHAIM